MSATALTRKRPTKAGDSGGGFTETLGAAYVFYGEIKIHKNATVLMCEIHEAIDTEDLIYVPGIDGGTEAAYRVGAITRAHGDRWMYANVERQNRPIEP